MKRQNHYDLNMQFMPNADNAPVRKSGAASRSIRRSYKPAPTMRYMVAGITAILLSMALIAGAMSATVHFDEKPWDPSQEMKWDPFERNMVPGLDLGGLTEMGHRKDKAIPQGGVLPGESDGQENTTVPKE